MAIVFEKHISCFSLYQINPNVFRTFLMFFEKKGWPNIYRGRLVRDDLGILNTHCRWGTYFKMFSHNSSPKTITRF